MRPLPAGERYFTREPPLGPRGTRVFVAQRRRVRRELARPRHSSDLRELLGTVFLPNAGQPPTRRPPSNDADGRRSRLSNPRATATFFTGRAWVPSSSLPAWTSQRRSEASRDMGSTGFRAPSSFPFLLTGCVGEVGPVPDNVGAGGHGRDGSDLGGASGRRTAERAAATWLCQLHRSGRTGRIWRRERRRVLGAASAQLRRRLRRR